MLALQWALRVSQKLVIVTATWGASVLTRGTSDKKGWSKLTSVFVENNKFLRNYLKRFLHSEQDIEDVVQEVYIKAAKAEQERTEDLEHPKAFLFTIAKNLAINELNHKSHKRTSYIQDCLESINEDESHSAEAESEAMQTLGIHCEAIAKLPEKGRLVYLLKRVHGLKHQEIADRLQISLSSVEKHLSMALAYCSEYIRKQENLDKPIVASRTQFRRVQGSK